MKIKKSTRGLTFSLANEEVNNNISIGAKYRYFIDKNNKDIIIVLDKNGSNTVSRKKSGASYKPLFDIRSEEVKQLVSSADYIEIEVLDNKIIAHTYRAAKTSIFEVINCEAEVKSSDIINIQDIIGEKTGEIILNKAVGADYPTMLWGKPTLADNYYFDYLCSQAPKSFINNKKNLKDFKKVYNVASLFSGAGLLDYSFKDSRIKFVYGVDFDANACMTYKENIGDHIVCDDIRNIKANSIPDVDIIIGGPCCQGYSNANRTDINNQSAKDKRLLIEDYVRIVKDKQPDVFVIENVPQLLTKEDGLYISKVIDNLSEYKITCSVIADDEVGGYTMRKRAIVIGSKIGKIELPSIALTTKKTVEDALLKVDSSWFNYEDVTLPRENTKLCMSYVPQGGNWRAIPEHIHKFGPSTQSNTYRRLAWDEQSPTITNWRKCILIHPEENRILNVSEAAALMGLDKNFKILGNSLDSRQQQVGNGVTQAIGRFVKNIVLNAMDKFYQVNTQFNKNKNLILKTC